MMSSLRGWPIRQFLQHLLILMTVMIFVAASGHTKNWYHRQWKEYENGERFSEAILLFEKAISEYPGEAWFYVYIGHSYLKLNRHAEGIPYLNKAARLSPKDPGVRRNVRVGLIGYGSQLRDGGKLEEALVYFEQAVAADTENAWSHNLLGHALTVAGKHARAYQAFRTSAQLAAAGEWSNVHFKGNIRLGLNEGSAYFRSRGDWEKALAYRELGARIFPEDWENSMALAETAHAAGKPRRARGIAQNIPLESSRRIFLAALDMFEGNPDAAEKTLADISRAHEGDSNTQHQISTVYDALVADMDYKTRMSSPLQKNLLYYATRSVEAYFEKHPYRQTQSFRAPLAESFCVRQGAGEISFHYGLRGHYSYDLTHCARDSTGMQVVAVAPGKVLAVVSDQPDQPIGSPVDVRAKANFIRIAHGKNVSLYLHLKQGSALVKVGDQVRAGQKIGEVGNSGISAGPHLHFNISNTEGITLPVRFDNIQPATDYGNDNGSKFERGIGLKRGSTYQPRAH